MLTRMSLKAHAESLIRLHQLSPEASKDILDMADAADQFHASLVVLASSLDNVAAYVAGMRRDLESKFASR